MGAEMPQSGWADHQLPSWAGFNQGDGGRSCTQRSANQGGAFNGSTVQARAAAGLMRLPGRLQSVDEGGEAGGEPFVAVIDPDVLANGG